MGFITDRPADSFAQNLGIIMSLHLNPCTASKPLKHLTEVLHRDWIVIYVLPMGKPPGPLGGKKSGCPYGPLRWKWGSLGSRCGGGGPIPGGPILISASGGILISPGADMTLACKQPHRPLKQTPCTSTAHEMDAMEPKLTHDLYWVFSNFISLRVNFTWYILVVYSII